MFFMRCPLCHGKAFQYVNKPELWKDITEAKNAKTLEGVQVKKGDPVQCGTCKRLIVFKPTQCRCHKCTIIEE